MASLKELEKKRAAVHAEMRKFDTDEPEYQPLFAECCKLAQEITHLHNREYLNTLRGGMQPFYRFIHNGFVESDFTPSVYRMLSRTFGNIAHYDRTSFYMVKFASDDLVIQTLQEMIGYTLQRMNEKGEIVNESPPELEQEIIEIVEESRILPKLKKKKVERTIEDEKKQLLMLTQKYGPVDSKDE
jgi:hypothetical protein